MAEAVNVREFRAHLARYLKQARDGAEFVVTAGGEAVARLGPPDAPKPRPIGLLKGRIRMAPDFDETPADIVAAMEGDEK